MDQFFRSRYLTLELIMAAIMFYLVIPCFLLLTRALVGKQWRSPPDILQLQYMIYY
jgi:hypothetical protein